jgi:transcriptional regulator
LLLAHEQINWKTTQHRAAVLELRAQGMTGRAIAKTLGTSNSNVLRLIAPLKA